MTQVVIRQSEARRRIRSSSPFWRYWVCQVRTTVQRLQDAQERGRRSRFGCGKSWSEPTTIGESQRGGSRGNAAERFLESLPKPGGVAASEPAGAASTAEPAAADVPASNEQMSG
jgi:hypothetical protein